MKVLRNAVKKFAIAGVMFIFQFEGGKRLQNCFRFENA